VILTREAGEYQSWQEFHGLQTIQISVVKIGIFLA
jgi:hypothetical protein